MVMYLGAFYWLWITTLPIWLDLPIEAAVLIGFIFHLRVYLFRNCAKAVTSMVWIEGNEWLLENCKGEEHPVTLLGNSVVSPWLIVLNFKPEKGGRKWPVVIMPDSVDSTTFRRLSAKLRMHSVEMGAIG